MRVRRAYQLGLGNFDPGHELGMETVDVGLTPLKLPESIDPEFVEGLAEIQQAQHRQMNEISVLAAEHDLREGDGGDYTMSAQG